MTGDDTGGPQDALPPLEPPPFAPPPPLEPPAPMEAPPPMEPTRVEPRPAEPGPLEPPSPPAQTRVTPPQDAVPPPGTFAPPPGTQYGSVPSGAGQPGGPQYPGGQYGAYSPYGGGQYAAGPYGYGMPNYGTPPGTNGMAIASLVLGICGFFCVTPFVGLGLGIAALSRTSKTGQAGRGLAIAGIILSSLWIALFVLLTVIGNVDIHAGSN
jgi:hypothetical protein